MYDIYQLISTGDLENYKYSKGFIRRVIVPLKCLISKFYFQKLFDSPCGHGQKIFSGRFALQGVSICANCQIKNFALKVAFLK